MTLPWKVVTFVFTESGRILSEFLSFKINKIITDLL